MTAGVKLGSNLKEKGQTLSQQILMAFLLNWERTICKITKWITLISSFTYCVSSKDHTAAKPAAQTNKYEMFHFSKPMLVKNRSHTL